MEAEMKDYLEEVAIKLKIENYKEFGKTKEEAQIAIMHKFNMSKEQARQKTEVLWNQYIQKMCINESHCKSYKNSHIVIKVIRIWLFLFIINF